MFKASQRYPFKPITSVLNNYNQEWLFLKYTGIYPDANKRYPSIFRSDRTPECRFEWRSGVLFFVDNAGYNGVTHFDIVGVICNLYGVSIPKAINMIENDNVPDFDTKTSYKEKRIPEIRFKYSEWPEENYFGVKPFDLWNENVYLVSDYWIKGDDIWIKNKIHNPRDTLTIAYYFPQTDKTKLYWPFETKFKWYSNCTDEIYGESKMDYYLERDKRLVVITKSQKDRLVFDYLLNTAAIAPQSETASIPDRIIRDCKKFDSQLIIYDNDYTGQKYAAKLSEETGFQWTCFEMGKDAYDNRFNLQHIKTKLYGR